MKYIIYSLVFGLSFFLFDLNLWRRNRFVFIGHSAMTREHEKEKKRRTQRLYKNRKYKKRPVFRERFYKFRDSKARAHRFSNQQTLRRMYRNS